MTIRTHPDDNSRWQVRATWLGQERVVFTGSLPGCIQFTIDHA